MPWWLCSSFNGIYMVLHKSRSNWLNRYLCMIILKEKKKTWCLQNDSKCIKLILWPTQSPFITKATHIEEWTIEEHFLCLLLKHRYKWFFGHEFSIPPAAETLMVNTNVDNENQKMLKMRQICGKWTRVNVSDQKPFIKARNVREQIRFKVLWVACHFFFSTLFWTPHVPFFIVAMKHNRNLGNSFSSSS